MPVGLSVRGYHKVNIDWQERVAVTLAKPKDKKPNVQLLLRLSRGRGDGERNQRMIWN